MMKAALLAAVLTTAVAAHSAPLEAFTSAVGEDGVKLLADRGFIVLQGRGADRRLAAVHWKALESFAAAAPSCAALARGETSVAACMALPDSGPVTPRLHALAQAVLAGTEEAAALQASGASQAEPAGLPNLFETAWGKELAARHRADRLEDPAALAKGFFDEFLAGPRPNPDAVKHFLAVEPGATAALNSDSVRGAASDDLRMTIRRYLQNERRRRGLALAQERVKKLTADRDVKKELDALGALAAAVGAKPGLLPSLEAAVSGAPAPSGVPRLRSAGLHLQEPTRLGQHELGDEAIVSGAYWVDGLPEKGSVEVEETTFLETSRGFLAAETRSVKRGNGGPYPYERRVVIAETRPFAVVAIVSAAAGTIVAERAEVPLAPDYELSLKKEAAALESARSCDPKSAEAAYAALEGLIADAAKIKPQYKSLADRAKAGRLAAADQVAALAKLEEAVADSRADSSPQQCRYDAARTDAAIKLARKLPPGCDRVLPELFAQRSLISRRAADQNWFLKASSEARSRRKSCDEAGAVRRWTEALTVLEADPAARCGKADAEAKAAEAELAEARRSWTWTETLGKALDKAEAEAGSGKRLLALAPVEARLKTLDGASCRRALIKRADALSEKSAADEAGPAIADVTLRLPPDATLSGFIDEVRRARARQLEKSDASYAPESSAAQPAPAAPPVKIVPKRAVKAKGKEAGK